MFRKLFFNTFAGYAVILSRLIIGLIAVPVYIKYLGVNLYGFMILVISTIGITTVFDFGLEEGMVKYLSESRTRQNQDDFNKYFNTFILLYSLIALLILGFGVLFYFFMPTLFNLENQVLTHAALVITLVTLESFVTFILKAFKGVILSYGRYDITNGGSAACTIVSNLLGMTGVLMGYGVVAVVFCRLLAALLREIFYMINAFRMEKRIDIKLHHVDLSRLIPIFSFSFYVFLGSASGILVRNFDIPIIGIFLPIHYVTAYDIILKIVDSLMDIAFQIYTSLFALYTELKDSGNLEGIKTLYLMTTKIMSSLVIVIASFTLTYLYQLIHFFSHGQVILSGEIFTLALLCVIERMIFITHSPSISILLTMGKHKLCGTSSILTGIINLATKGLFVKWFGFIGVFINNIVPTVLVQLLLINLINALKILSISLKEYLYVTLIRNLLPAGIVIIIYQLTNTFLHTEFILFVLLEGLGGGLLYLFLFYRYTLLPEEKNFLKGKLARFLPQSAV